MTRATPPAHPVRFAPPRLSDWGRSPTGVPFVHERAGSEPGPEILLAALVHGNEYAGALALDAFLRTGMRPRRGRITVMFCNVAAFERFDPSKPDASRFVDEDFNRVWHPHRLDGQEVSTELRRARELRPFVERATHLLDLHTMHEPSAPLMVTGLWPRNVTFALSLGAPLQVVVDGGHADGVRMRDYGAFGEEQGARIALLLESGQHWELGSVGSARNVLMRFLVQAGSLARRDIPMGWLLPDTQPPLPVLVTDRVVAHSMDFEFTQDFRGGEVIRRAGTLIARDAGLPIVTPYDDCVLVMPSVRQLRPGVTTVRLGRRGEATPLTP